MPHPTNKTTPLSLSTSTLKKLYPNTLSGDEALSNFTLAGVNNSALALAKSGLPDQYQHLGGNTKKVDGVPLTNKASASQTVGGDGMLTLKGGLIQQN